jgi:hypothetical protein
MNPARHILSPRARKELCRVPGLLNHGRADSAARLLDKHRGLRSPLVLAYDIGIAETRGDKVQARSLYRSRDAVLRHAARNGPAEIAPFFTFLFAFYVGRGRLAQARAVFRAGRGYGMEQSDYGMLWARYCDAAGLIADGLETVKRVLGDKKLSPAERKFLTEHYPRLAAAGAFDRANRTDA